MVYPGRPSHGCLACIARKVKCDEGKPQCERCIKREQPCPGYRNPRDRKFVSMNKTRSAHPTSGAPTSSRPSSEASGSRQHEPESSNSVRQNFGANLIPLQQNFCDQAVCLFFHQYIIAPSDDGNPGYLDFLPELFEHSKADDALAQAVKAISYIGLSGKTSVKVLSARGHEHYRITLQRITQMLESPVDTAQDSLIVAIMLVVLFENVTREKPAVMMNHAKGLQALLLHRGVGQFSSSQGKAIYRHVNSQTLVRNIELSEHPSSETMQWLQGLDMSSLSANSIGEKYRIAQVRATATEAFSQSHDSRELHAHLLEILQQARNLDAEVARWAENLPRSSQYHIWRLDENGTAEQIIDLLDRNTEVADAPPGLVGNSSQHILTYAGIWFALLWHSHRTSRLMLNETIVRLARRLALPAAIRGATTIMQKMCRDTCASIPFSLGDIRVHTDVTGREILAVNLDSRMEKGAGAGAYAIVWSLRHVVSCEFASEAQVESASEALVRIGAQFGIKQAFTLSSRQYQCHPNAGSR